MTRAPRNFKRPLSSGSWKRQLTPGWPGRAAPIAQTPHAWLLTQRARITDGTAKAKAIDYSLTQ
jgi:hypothetical protein